MPGEEEETEEEEEGGGRIPKACIVRRGASWPARSGPVQSSPVQSSPVQSGPIRSSYRRRGEAGAAAVVAEVMT